MQDVARVMQEATQSGGVRPYGVSLLIAGWDDGIEPENEDAAVAGADVHPMIRSLQERRVGS